MNRRTFFYSCSFSAAAVVFTGCDKTSKKSDKATSVIENTKNIAIDNFEPFTQKLKIPKVIDFEHIAKAKFNAQKSLFPIYDGKKTDVLTFQDELPNPTIRIKKDDDFELDFINSLEKPTIIHWHGLLVPQEMDGHPKDAIATQMTKEYRYKINQRAGTFWYHTHPHGRTGEEIYYGLSGLYIIEDDDEKALNLPSGEFELPLIIQDRRFDKEKNLIYKETPQDNNGVLGDVIIVNSTPYPYTNVKNTKYRLRILNGSSARTYKLAFEGIEDFMLIGTDGGLLEEPIIVKDLLIAVAERIDIIVDFKDKKVGESVTLKTLGFKEASNFITNPAYPNFGAKMDIMRFKITELSTENSLQIPKKLSTITKMKASDASKNRVITMEIIEGGIWTLNKKPYDMHRVDERVKLGSTEIWEIKNSAHMAHPFHMHGVHFQVLERTSSIDFPTDKGYKDTVLVMPLESVRIIVKFTIPGLFVHHCHILEHEDHSMMANFLVE
ncbi:multicopper oxidase family protein [Sulfurimonas sp.]|uniref:multicopper oxidase family protein n=1 Tax=Sulfurimonas sp. TaxID=2022749 RepID=UPI0025D80B8E|nr:multicopper oxidase family protein [Sulfurimonas sp.]MCK9473197.1 multicopper oxidase family protein [Sulfurimonas sp.]